MKKEEITGGIIEIISGHLNMEKKNISEKDRLMEDLGASSFDVMIILPEIEAKFGIEFSVSALRQIFTIEDLAEYTEAELNMKSSKP